MNSQIYSETYTQRKTKNLLVQKYLNFIYTYLYTHSFWSYSIEVIVELAPVFFETTRKLNVTRTKLVLFV